MIQFIVWIYFKNGRLKIIENVDILTYSANFHNNKWETYLDISQTISTNPTYYYYKHNSIKKIEIFNGE